MTNIGLLKVHGWLVYHFVYGCLVWSAHDSMSMPNVLVAALWWI